MPDTSEPIKEEQQQLPVPEKGREATVTNEGDEGQPVQHEDRQRVGIPGGDGFYVSPEGGANVYNAAKETIRFPFDDPADYLARTIITERDLQNYLLKFSRRQRMYTGWSDPQLIDQMRFAGNISIGGQGRLQFVQITTAEHQRNIMQRALGAMGGVQDRIKQQFNKGEQQQ